MHIHDEYAMNIYFKVCDTLILHSIHDSKQDTGSYAAPKLFIPRSILVYCDNFRLQQVFSRYTGGDCNKSRPGYRCALMVLLCFEVTPGQGKSTVAQIPMSGLTQSNMYSGVFGSAWTQLEACGGHDGIGLLQQQYLHQSPQRRPRHDYEYLAERDRNKLEREQVRAP